MKCQCSKRRKRMLRTNIIMMDLKINQEVLCIYPSLFHIFSWESIWDEFLIWFRLVKIKMIIDIIIKSMWLLHIWRSLGWRLRVKFLWIFLVYHNCCTNTKCLKYRGSGNGVVLAKPQEADEPVITCLVCWRNKQAIKNKESTMTDSIVLWACSYRW